MNILVTGGAGYIGSHAAVALCDAGHTPVLIDNFCNSAPGVLARLEKIAGKSITLLEGDIRNRSFLDQIFDQQPVDCVMHFAGLKAVGESVEQPLNYYDNNVAGTLRLLEAMTRVGCRKIIFSSSATVYGDAKTQPIAETAQRTATNPYGQSKLVVEYILEDLCRAEPDFSAIVLRYFNPVGAHDSGLIGESPTGVPNNLMPFIAQVAVGQRPALSVFGSDYDTTDGTGVRDFIHVMDLVEGHVAALTLANAQVGFTPVNLGTGRGASVLEMVRAFESVSGRAIPYKLAPRRDGDVAVSYADPSRAKSLLGWSARRTIEDMCRDTWRWQSASIESA